MEAFTPWGGRRTRVMGSMGFIEGDASKFHHLRFRTDQSNLWSKVLDVANYKNERSLAVVIGGW